MVSTVPVTERTAPVQEPGVNRSFLLSGGLFLAGGETIDGDLSRLAPSLNEVPYYVNLVVGVDLASLEFGDDSA